MKKQITFFTVLSILTFLTANAKAEGFVSADILGVYARHNFSGQNDFQGNLPNRIQTPQQKEVDGTNVGFGLSAGTKLYAGEAFFSTELFWDYVNSRTRDFYSQQLNIFTGEDSYHHDRLIVDNRYGIKFNLGYRIYKDLDIFATLGASRARYEVLFNNTGESYKEYHIAPLYGAGFIYDLDEHLSVKLAYDFQSFNMRYVFVEQKDIVHLHVARLGMIYSF